MRTRALLTLSAIAGKAAALVLLGAICTFSWVVGHNQTKPANAIPADGLIAPDSDQLRLVHDAGRLLTNSKAVHTFRVENKTGQQLAIKTNRDISRDCGCAALEPRDRQLEPGEATDVTLAVKSPAAEGSFRHGGSITWTRADGKPISTQFLMTAEIIPAIIRDPVALDFSNDDVRGGIARRVNFREVVPIAWKEFQVRVSHNQFSIGKVQTHETGATVYVTAHPKKDESDVEGVLLAVVGAKESDAAAAGTEFKVEIPLRARQIIKLSCRPSILAFRFQGDTVKKSSARVLLQGHSAKRFLTDVEDIKCGACKVAWQPVGSSAEHALLEISLTIAAEELAESWNERLVFCFRDGGQFVLACVRTD